MAAGSAAPLPPWSAQDEEVLNKVRGHLSTLELRRGHALDRLRAAAKAAGFEPDTSLPPGADLAQIVMNADALRDALAPFDSGVRPSHAGGSES